MQTQNTLPATYRTINRYTLVSSLKRSLGKNGPGTGATQSAQGRRAVLGRHHKLASLIFDKNEVQSGMKWSTFHMIAKI